STWSPFWIWRPGRTPENRDPWSRKSGINGILSAATGRGCPGELTIMITSEPCSVSFRLRVLQHIFSLATREASEVMSRWTEGRFTLKLGEVREVPLTDAWTELRLDEKRQTMVVLSLEGKLGGAMFFHFDDEDSRLLATALMGESPPTDAPWSEMEQSAVTETGNILGCAYLNAIARLIDQTVIPSAPYFLQDYGSRIFQQVLTPRDFSSDCVLIFRTGFLYSGKELEWCVLFVPSPALRTVIENAIQDD
ncbi:MAG: chemotaxis protein CheC, partial [Pirellulales bacterium]|nr:chemotaxis protein CheC [Pirellulales bacterium]